MKKGLIILVVALTLMVVGFTYTMASIKDCLEADEIQLSEKTKFCPTYLPEIMGVDDEFWG